MFHFLKSIIRRKLRRWLDVPDIPKLMVWAKLSGGPRDEIETAVNLMNLPKTIVLPIMENVGATYIGGEQITRGPIQFGQVTYGRNLEIPITELPISYYHIHRPEERKAQC